MEAVIYLVAFNFYYKLSKDFDLNMIAFTLLIVVSFMMRCTSPIGFIFLIIYKLLKEKNLQSFMISGLLIAIPSMILIVALETYYYG